MGRPAQQLRRRFQERAPECSGLVRGQPRRRPLRDRGGGAGCGRDGIDPLFAPRRSCGGGPVRPADPAMVAPLFLLVGVHPGTGRRLLVRWAELAAAALLIRVLCAALLALVLVLSGLIAQIPNWGVAAALEVALVVTAFIYRKPFLRVFGQVATPRLDFLRDGRTATTVVSGTNWVLGKLGR